MRLPRSISMMSAALLLAAASAWPALLPYPNAMPKVDSDVPYDTVLKRTWEGIKARNVKAYTTGLVHRPKSDKPGDAVSEGVAYGMFLALYANDQEYFNSIWNAGERYMWNSEGSWGNPGNYYDWRRSSTGGSIGNGPASDADQDIALLLIFADKLVESGVWKIKDYKSVKGATYAARAKDMLNTIRTSMVAGNGALLPGHWGDGDADTTGIINPGYFAPAFYRVFAEFDSANASAWKTLIDKCYAHIAKSPGYSLGLVPDWFKFNGGSTGGAGYNAYFKGDALYRDAIRVYWRLGIDYLWYGEPRAKTLLDNAFNFITQKGGASKANFFDMSGNLLPEDDTEVLGDGENVNITRKRREHSHLTTGMWAIVAMASGGKDSAKSYGDELLGFYEGKDYWGRAVDPSGGSEDTLHNEMYFDQFLAWFGASVLGGVFANVWDDLKYGVPDKMPEWKSRPVLTPANHDVNAEIEPLRVTASFTSRARWTVTLKHATGAARTFTANSDTVDVSWYGLSETGAYMPRGFYSVVVDAAGLEGSPYVNRVWLGRPYASGFLEGNRLLVDDFADGDYIPNIGNVWTSYLDSHEGKNGESTAKMSIKKESDGKEWLSWEYSLKQGNLGYNEPHAALEWNCQTASGGVRDLRGIDTIIVAARSLNGAIGVSVQLVSDDIGGPQYFEDSLRLTTTSPSGGYKLYVPGFKQRMNGSGKNLQSTLQKMTAIRFHVQYPEGAANTIMVERIYFAGDLSNIYTFETPPSYIAPPEDVPIGVRHGASPSNSYSVKRGVNAVTITLPGVMSGASAALIDVRGRTVMRMDVRKDGVLSVPLKGLARGVYFVDIRGRGRSLRVRVVKSSR